MPTLGCRYVAKRAPARLRELRSDYAKLQPDYARFGPTTRALARLRKARIDPYTPRFHCLGLLLGGNAKGSRRYIRLSGQIFTLRRFYDSFATCREILFFFLLPQMSLLA